MKHPQLGIKDIVLSIHIIRNKIFTVVIKLLRTIELNGFDKMILPISKHT